MSNHVKKWEGRTFLNSWDKTCTEYVQWRVEVHESYIKEGHYTWWAEFNTSKGMSLWAEKKGELRPMQIAQREINKFNDACEEAQRMVEEHNNA